MTWNRVDGLIVLRPAGDLREGELGDEMECALYKLAGQGRRVVLDLGDTRQLSARALGILANSAHQTLLHGGRLALCGLNERHRWLLGITQLANVLDVYDSELTAVAALTVRPAVA